MLFFKQNEKVSIALTLLWSNIKKGLRFQEIIPTPINSTSLVIGEIEHLILPKNSLSQNGRVDLSIADSVGFRG